MLRETPTARSDVWRVACLAAGKGCVAGTPSGSAPTTHPDRTAAVEPVPSPSQSCGPRPPLSGMCRRLTSGPQRESNSQRELRNDSGRIMRSGRKARGRRAMDLLIAATALAADFPRARGILTISPDCRTCSTSSLCRGLRGLTRRLGGWPVPAASSQPGSNWHTLGSPAFARAQPGRASARQARRSDDLLLNTGARQVI